MSGNDQFNPKHPELGWHEAKPLPWPWQWRFYRWITRGRWKP